MRVLLLRLFLGSLLCCSALQAADLREVVMDRQGGVYLLRSTVWFDVSPESLYAIFLDYDLAEKYSSFVVESRNLEPGDDGRRRFYIRNQGCVLFFCQSFERIGAVEHEPFEQITATAIAAESDFESSVETWTLAEEGEGTLVVYTFEFEPKFWIPPLIGPYVLERKLEQDSLRALERIEALAKKKT